jgi:hypothetical protein
MSIKHHQQEYIPSSSIIIECTFNLSPEVTKGIRVIKTSKFGNALIILVFDYQLKTYNSIQRHQK